MSDSGREPTPSVAEATRNYDFWVKRLASLQASAKLTATAVAKLTQLHETELQQVHNTELSLKLAADQLARSKQVWGDSKKLVLEGEPFMFTDEEINALVLLSSGYVGDILSEYCRKIAAKMQASNLIVKAAEQVTAQLQDVLSELCVTDSVLP